MPEPKEKSVAELVFDVSERTSSLIREEVELAKVEVTEKVTKLLRGSAVGAAAGAFAFLALILIMEGVAWLLNEQVFDNFWAGFFVEAAIFLLVAAGRRLVRLQERQGRRPAGPRAGDRGGEADQDDDRRRREAADAVPDPFDGGPRRDSASPGARRPASGSREMSAPSPSRFAAPAPRCRPAPRPRSAPTSTPSARTSATRSRRSAPRSPSSPTGAARPASIARS